MIRPAIHDARVRESQPNEAGQSRWLVLHYDSILAYCDTKEEAERYRDAINDLPRQLRAVGVEIR